MTKYQKSILVQALRENQTSSFEFPVLWMGASRPEEVGLIINKKERTLFSQCNILIYVKHYVFTHA